MPLLVAGGGGGAACSERGGSAGGVGPFLDGGTAGRDGTSCSGAYASGGGGGGGAGFPNGGSGQFYSGTGECFVYGGGGQSWAPDGLTAVGTGSAPGNTADSDRPLNAGVGASRHSGRVDPAGHGALVYTFAPRDVSPEPFAFDALDGVAPGAVVESAPRQPLGFDGPLTLLVAGVGAPQVSVAGRAWASEERIMSGDTLVLRQTASDVPGASRTALLLIGASSVEWSVTTASAAPSQRDGLAVGCGCAGLDAPSARASLWVAALVTAAALAIRRARRPTRAGGGLRPERPQCEGWQRPCTLPLRSRQIVLRASLGDASRGPSSFWPCPSPSRAGRSPTTRSSPPRPGTSGPSATRSSRTGT